MVMPSIPSSQAMPVVGLAVEQDLLIDLVGEDPYVGTAALADHSGDAG